MRSAFALCIISGKTILNFGVRKRLRAFLNPFSHKWGRKKRTPHEAVSSFFA